MVDYSGIYSAENSRADKFPTEINYWERWMQTEECSYLCDSCKWQEHHPRQYRAIA